MMHVTVEYPKRANITVKLPAVPRAFINTDHGPKGDPGATGPRGIPGAKVGLLAARPAAPDADMVYGATDATDQLSMFDKSSSAWTEFALSSSKVLARWAPESAPPAMVCTVKNAFVMSPIVTPDFVMPDGIVEVSGSCLYGGPKLLTDTTAALAWSTDSGATWTTIRDLPVEAWIGGLIAEIGFPPFQIDTRMIAAGTTVSVGIQIKATSTVPVTYAWSLPPNVQPSVTVVGPL